MAKNQREDRYTDNHGNIVTETRDTSHTLESGAEAIAETLGWDDEPEGEEGQRRPSRHPNEHSVGAAANEIFDQLPEDELDNPEPVDPDAEEAEAEDVEAEADDYEDEEAEENADGEEGEDSEEEKHRLRADGEDIELTYDELLEYASKGHNYTRKTQQMAEERRELEGNQHVVSQMAEAYGQRLEMLMNAQQQLGLDPQTAQHLEQEYVQVRRAQEMQALQEHAETLEAEKELLVQAIPEWGKDPEAAQAEKDALMQYAVNEAGYEPHEVRSVADHRALVLLRKAYLYDQAQAKAGDVVSKKKTSKTLQPGARQKTHPNAKGRKAAEKAMSRARRTGRVEDAADYLLTSGILDD